MALGNVTVVIPSQQRPERLLRAVESVLSTAPGIKVVCVLEEGDDDSRAILAPLEAMLAPIEICWIPKHDWTTAERWNWGAYGDHETDYWVTGADDVIFQHGWYEALTKTMKQIGGSGLVGMNEGPGSAFGKLATHFIVSRKYAALGLGGVLMPPPYKHGWTDMEATMRAKRDGRLAFCAEARIHHLHPFYGTADTDAIYEKGSSTHAEDEELFKARMLEGFRNTWEPVIDYPQPDGWGTVAVGLRSYRNVDTDFLRNWTIFVTGGLRQGDRIIDIDVGKGKAHHNAANDLALAFLSSDCDSLLLVDDDMIIPASALASMRDNIENWDYDIVQGFCTFKSFPPHAVAYVLSDEQPEMPERLNGQRYNAYADLQDGEVREVDAVGMAFTLIKRSVLESMIGEFGPEYTTWFDFGGHAEMEDMRFSERCRGAGFAMAVDTNAKVEHIGTTRYGWRQHKQYVKTMEISNG